jgi:hypothetical protein
VQRRSLTVNGRNQIPLHKLNAIAGPISPTTKIPPAMIVNGRDSVF